MAASHQSLRDDFEVSCSELDLMVDLANKVGFEGGVLGSRTGPLGNIIKIRPTLATLPEHVDILLEALDNGFGAVG